VGGPGETGEVVEIKFDVHLANDEERDAFARTQVQSVLQCAAVRCSVFWCGER